MEYMDCGTLHGVIMRHREIPINCCKYVLWSIVQGILVMHCGTHPIMHRDLKTENVVVNTKGSVKIIDLTFGKIIKGDGEDAHSNVGTPA